MKILIFLLVWFLTSCHTFAQDDHRAIIDSIVSELNTYDDSLKLEAYLRLTTHYKFIEGGRDSVKYYADEALSLAHTFDNTDKIIAANYYIGSYYYTVMMDADSAIIQFQKVRDLLHVHGPKVKLPNVLNALAASYMAGGKYEKALTSYHEGLDIASANNDLTNLAFLTSNIAIIYSRMGDHEASIKSYKEALAYNDASENKEKKYIHVNTSINLLGEYKNMDSLKHTAAIIEDLRPMVDSLKYYQASDRLLLAELEYLNKVGETDKLYDLADANYKKLSKRKGIDKRIYNNTLYYHAQSQNAKGNRRRVTEVCNILTEELQSKTDVKHKLELLEMTADLHNEIENFEKAYNQQIKFKLLSDSIQSEEITQRLEEAKIKYELEKKENELIRKNVEALNIKKKTISIISFLLGLLLLMSLVYLRIFKKRQKEQELVNNLEQKLLALQMNPHFIFNAISSIQNYLYDAGDTKTAIRHLSSFGTLMRQMLENSRSKYISLEEEIEFLTHYLEMQQLRYDYKFDFHITCDKSIDSSAVSIPPLMIQPFIENAIEHAKIHLKDDGQISVEFSANDNDELSVSIYDNGIGIQNVTSQAIKDNRNLKKKSLSMQITKERLGLFSKFLKKKYQMYIDSTSGQSGTTIILDLPTVNSY